MERNEIIGKRLKECRKALGLSQSEIAGKLNVQRQVISYFETGARTPSITDIIQLANIFNVTSDYLLGLTDVKSNDIDLKSVCEYTGLSEKSVEHLTNEPLIFGDNYIAQKIIETLNEFLAATDFDLLMSYIVEYKRCCKVFREKDEEFRNIIPLGDEKYEEIMELWESEHIETNLKEKSEIDIDQYSMFRLKKICGYYLFMIQETIKDISKEMVEREATNGNHT